MDILLTGLSHAYSSGVIGFPLSLMLENSSTHYTLQDNIKQTYLEAAKHMDAMKLKFAMTEEGDEVLKSEQDLEAE